MSTRIWRCIGWVPVLGLAAGTANGQGVASGNVILNGGFTDHVEASDHGRIDWTNGYILGEGIGYAQGVDRQNELLARQAARTVALRNALALAQGIRIDAYGTVGGLGDGAVRVQGFIRGHEQLESEWFPAEVPPRARTVVRVPLWGVTSVAALFQANHQARLTPARVVRRPLVVNKVDVSDFVVVIDARGLGLSASLFPVVRDDEGGLLYDVTTPEGQTNGAPLARFVESDLSFDELRAANAQRSASNPGAQPRCFLAGYQASDQVPGRSVDEALSTQPTTQPSEEPAKRRAKRHLAVRAASAGGQSHAEVVLTSEDVDRIRRSPEGASALREAHVVIVVDAAAAGTEGRLDQAPAGTYLADGQKNATPPVPNIDG